MKTKKIKLGSIALFTAGLVSAAGQNAAYGQLDEIIVTAQKREQNLQDIPGAVTAVSAEAIRMAGLLTIEDLQTLAPSVSVSSVNLFGQSTIINMRGVGTSSTNVGLEAAVGFFLDGVYRSRSGLGVGDLVDIDRIEVLRGPQGTLFGKNTSAGAIHVITQQPSYEFEGMGEATFGNLDAKRVRAFVNAPIMDNELAFRVSGGYSRRDGWITDVTSGADYNDLDRWNVRAKMLWEPTSSIDVLVIGDWSEADESTQVALRTANGPVTSALFGPLSLATGGILIDPPNPGSLETSLNDGARGEFTDRGISAEINWDFGPATFTSISAYRNYESFALKDGDNTAVDLFLTEFTFDQEMFTQEARVAGIWEDPPLIHSIDWLAGFYFSKETVGSMANFPAQTQTQTVLSFFASLFSLTLPPAAFAGPPDGFQTRSSDGTSYSGFAHATINLTDRLALTGGARFNRERKIANTVDNTVAGIGNNLIGFQGNFVEIDDERFTDEEWTGEVAVHYDWTDDIMTYVKFAHGFKAGGVNIDGGGAGTSLVPADPIYDSETSNNYEIGVRSQFWNGNATLNVTGFLTQFNDFQLQSFDGVSFILNNVSGVRTRGVEVDAVVSPLEGLLLAGGLAFVDADFDDGVTNGFAVLGDSQLPSSPKWAGNLSGTYRYPLPDTGVTVVGHGEISFRSRTNLDSTALLPTAVQNGYSLVNGRLAVQSNDEAWEVALWCRNCGDKQYSIFAFEGFLAGTFEVIGTPRTWGATLTGRF